MNLPDAFKQTCSSSPCASRGLGGREPKKKLRYVGWGDCTCLRETFHVGLLLMFINYLLLVPM